VKFLIKVIAHITVNNYLLLCDDHPTCFSLYRLSSGRSLTEEYFYSKCCQRCAYGELNTVLSIKILQIMYKMWINYRYFTFLDNFMFGCRQTSMSLL